MPVIPAPLAVQVHRFVGFSESFVGLVCITAGRSACDSDALDLDVC